MTGKVYALDYDDEPMALRILYWFFSCRSLTRPECTIWKNALSMRTLRHNSGNGLISEKDFVREILSSPFAAISCVASTDKADQRRVVLRYQPELECILVSFPMANGGLNAAERSLMHFLEQGYRI